MSKYRLMFGHWIASHHSKSSLYVVALALDRSEVVGYARVESLVATGVAIVRRSTRLYRAG